MKSKIFAAVLIVLLLILAVVFLIPSNEFAIPNRTGTTTQNEGTEKIVKSTAQNEGQLIIDLVKAIKKSFE